MCVTSQLTKDIQNLSKRMQILMPDSQTWCIWFQALYFASVVLSWWWVWFTHKNCGTLHLCHSNTIGDNHLRLLFGFLFCWRLNSEWWFSEKTHVYGDPYNTQILEQVWLATSHLQRWVGESRPISIECSQPKHSWSCPVVKIYSKGGGGGGGGVITLFF